MNRRKFLRGFGAAAAATGIAGAVIVQASPKAPARGVDDFDHKGYRVKWREFGEPVNQAVVVGMWRAKHYTQDNEWVSTTLGQCYMSRAHEVVDLTKEDGWPLLTTFSSEAEREVVKQLAKDALLAVL
jgi:hypothetical protein